MVTVIEIKGSFNGEEPVSEESLREERRRTGRYVATVIAIFVSLFGLYQALARGTPEYAAFFLPALIMFLYVLWILYASRARGKASNENLENEDISENSGGVIENPISPSNTTMSDKPSTSSDTRSFCRSYSIA